MPTCSYALGRKWFRVWGFFATRQVSLFQSAATAPHLTPAPRLPAKSLVQTISALRPETGNLEELSEEFFFKKIGVLNKKRVFKNPLLETCNEW